MSGRIQGGGHLYLLYISSYVYQSSITLGISRIWCSGTKESSILLSAQIRSVTGGFFHDCLRTGQSLPYRRIMASDIWFRDPNCSNRSKDSNKIFERRKLFDVLLLMIRNYKKEYRRVKKILLIH